MICNKCKTRLICKNYDFLKNHNELTISKCDFFNERTKKETEINITKKYTSSDKLFNSLKEAFYGVKESKKQEEKVIQFPKSISEGLSTVENPFVKCKNCGLDTIPTDIKKCSKCGKETCSSCGLDLINMENPKSETLEIYRLCDECHEKEFKK